MATGTYREISAAISSGNRPISDKRLNGLCPLLTRGLFTQLSMTQWKISVSSLLEV